MALITWATRKASKFAQVFESLLQAIWVKAFISIFPLVYTEQQQWPNSVHILERKVNFYVAVGRKTTGDVEARCSLHWRATL